MPPLCWNTIKDISTIVLWLTPGSTKNSFRFDAAFDTMTTVTFQAYFRVEPCAKLWTQPFFWFLCSLRHIDHRNINHRYYITRSLTSTVASVVNLFDRRVHRSERAPFFTTLRPWRTWSLGPCATPDTCSCRGGWDDHYRTGRINFAFVRRGVCRRFRVSTTVVYATRGRSNISDSRRRDWRCVARERSQHARRYIAWCAVVDVE